MKAGSRPTARSRMVRVDRMLYQALAELIPRVIKDPRYQHAESVTIKQVKTSPDLHTSKVFVSVLGGAKVQQQTLGVLREASGRLRAALSQSVRLRRTPELHFELDRQSESAARIERILRELASDSDDVSNG